LMTANIVLFLRVRSRPRAYPHKGFVRAGFFFSRYGANFRPAGGAIPQIRAKTSGARNFLRRVAGLIAGALSKSRKTGPKTGQIRGISVLLRAS
jgi:hypothetical protein